MPAWLNLPYRPLAIYQLRVVPCGVSPLVWRRLLVASNTSLAELHEILQLAFDWSDDHLHRFLIQGTAYGLPRLGGITFRENARRVPLSRFRLHGGEHFRYEYDFTADWQLNLRLERALPFDPDRFLPPCIGGSRAAPPEGCAGALDYGGFCISPRKGSIQDHGAKAAWSPDPDFSQLPNDFVLHPD
jgi:hypothetical protein